MPYKSPEQRRAYQNSHNAAKRPAPEKVGKLPRDPVAALAKWAREVLKVPPGHPNSGKPMTLPPSAVDFLRDALSHSESALLVARKNSKSAIVAVYGGPPRAGDEALDLVARQGIAALAHAGEEVADAEDADAAEDGGIGRGPGLPSAARAPPPPAPRRAVRRSALSSRGRSRWPRTGRSWLRTGTSGRLRPRPPARRGASAPSSGWRARARCSSRAPGAGTTSVSPAARSPSLCSGRHCAWSWMRL